MPAMPLRTALLAAPFIAAAAFAPGAREQITLPLSATAQDDRDRAARALGAAADRGADPRDPRELHAARGGDRRAVGESGLARAHRRGLRDGWISVDLQKRAWSDFEGARAGEIEVPLGSGDHDVVAKIETAEGVSVVDIRRVTRESAAAASR